MLVMMAPHKRNRRRGDHPRGGSVKTPPPHQVVPAQPQESRSFGEAPEPDIPVLKEKEKERKGAGIPGYAGSGSGGSGLGMSMGSGSARVGSSLVAQPGFLGSGRIAAALSNFFGGRATTLGALFASKAGPAFVLGGLAAWTGVIGLAGLKLAGFSPRMSQGVSNANTSAFLGAVGDSGIVIDAPKDRSLGYLADANQGEIVWNREHPMAPKNAPQEDEVAEPKGEAPPDIPKFEMPDVSALMGEGLDRDKFVKKMTQDTSSLHGRRGLQAGTAGFNLKKTFAKALTPRQVKLGGARRLARVKNKLRGRSINTRRGASSKAMAQLKLARNMSHQGAASAADAAQRQYSTDAFEQGQTIGGGLAGIEGGGVVVPPRAGVSYGVNDVSPPPVGAAGNVTPYQSQLDGAQGMGDSAASMKLMSIMLIAIGIALIAAGASAGPIIGPILIAIGTAVVAMGMMMMMMSQNMARSAKNQGQNIEDQYGQTEQSEAVDNCADQASGSGTTTADCDPGSTLDDVDGSLTNDIGQSVSEVRNSRYTGADGQGGVGIETDGLGSDATFD